MKPPQRTEAERIAAGYRVKRRSRWGKSGWGVQQRGRWFWRWVGPFGDARLGHWPDSAGALWFANLCERVDARSALLSQEQTDER